MRARRVARQPTTRAGTATGVTAIAQGNDYIGVAVGDDRLRAGRRLVGAGRDDLELGGRLRARLPGGGLLLSLAAGLAAGASRTVGVTHDVTTTRDRAAEEAAAATPRGDRTAPAAR